MNWYRYLPDPGKYQRKEIVLIRLDYQCDNIKFRKLKFGIVREISKHCQETEYTNAEYQIKWKCWFF